MRKLASGLAILAIVAAGLAGCMSAGRGPGPVAAFVIPAAANPGLSQDIVATVSPGGEPRDIFLVVPVGTNVHALVAQMSLTAEAVITVISTGSRVVQQNGVTPNDFSVPVLYSIEISGEKEPWRYRVNVRQTDTNPRLAQLVLPPGSRLTPVFGPAVRAYRLDVPYESTSVRIEARAQSRFARSITVNGKETPGPAGGADVDFTGLLQKPVTIETLAEDGATRERYVVTIVRAAPDSNALLASLDLQGVPFSPAFSPAQLGYQAIVPFETQSVVVRARSQSRVATVSLAAAVSISGGRATAAPLSMSGDPAAPAGAAVDFSQGPNLPLVVAVTAQDGSVQQYLLDIRRAPPDSNSLLADLSLGMGGMGIALSPAFTPSRPTYIAVVPFSTQQVTVFAHPQSRVAALQLAGGVAGGRGTFSFRGNPMSPDGAIVDVPPGADRFPVFFLVTAQDGTLLRYAVELRRAAPDRNTSLASLTTSAGLFSPPFTPRTQAYFLVVPADVDSVKLTALPAGFGATVGIAEQPGIAPAPGISYIVSVPPGGQAAVGFIVRAEDGSQTRYQIQLTRPLPPAVQAPVQPAPQPQPAPVQPVPVQPAPAKPAPAQPAQAQPAPAQPAPAQPAPAQPATAQPAPNPPAAGGSDRFTISAQNLPLLFPPGVLVLREMPTKVGTVTVRPYRSSELILQTQIAVDLHVQGGKAVFSFQYKSPGVSLGRNRLIEFEVAIPTLGGHFFYYKEAVPADDEENLAVPFLVFSTSASIPWPAVGSPVQAAGYVSMVPPGRAERAEDKEAFQKNAKGEYGIEIQITDAKSGKPLGKDTVWRKPGLARGQPLGFTAPMGVPEGSAVSYVLTARVPGGRTWTAAGQTQVWTTRLRADGGFEPVLLPISDELAPGSDDKDRDKGDRGDKGDKPDRDKDNGKKQ